MFIPFNQLPESSRIWIYQASRMLTPVEVAAISGQLRAFTERWAAHNIPLQASFTISYQRFIVLAANEQVNAASGCSIDESVHLMKEIEKQFSLDLFNRDAVAFLIKENVMVIPVAALRATLAEGKWNSSSQVFDISTKTVGDLKNRWPVSACDTWLKRYLDKVTV